MNGALILNSEPHKRLRTATIAARLRTHKLIAVGVEAGKYQVQEIIPKGNTSDVIPLADYGTLPAAIETLNNL